MTAPLILAFSPPSGEKGLCRASRFLGKIRDEKRFDSLGELIDQIRKDVEAVKASCLGPRPE